MSLRNVSTRNMCHPHRVFGPAHNTVKLIQQCDRNSRLTYWENFYILNYSNNRELINEQYRLDYNILYDLPKYTNCACITQNHQTLQRHTT
jgi:hypothetical protein